jgi:AcrR family transcriptional regulator
MTHVAAREGYAEMSIAHLTSQAGVSRQTFYELFEDKEDCFLAAYEQVATRTLAALAHPLETTGWWESAPRAVRALFEQIESDPREAWLLLVEGLASGACVRERRITLLAKLEGTLADFLDAAPAGELTLDIAPVALVGAVRAIVRAHLVANSIERLPTLVEDFVAWMRAYAAPAGHKRFTAHVPMLPATLSNAQKGQTSTTLLPRPDPLPRGRHNLPAGIVARNRRERIVYATCEIALAKGYVEMTVADIVRAAGISREIFYEYFTDKQSAFLAAQRYADSDLFRACALAYFTGETWPLRVWSGLGMLCTLAAAEPALSHLRMVEPYAAGTDALERLQETSAGFTLFLAEGYYYRTEAKALPQVCFEAIGGAIIEIIRREIEAGRTAELPRHLPELAYTALAPFTGAVAAAELVRELSTQTVAAGSCVA